MTNLTAWAGGALNSNLVDFQAAFNAADLGADAEMDGQGRITFNPELRRELDLEGHELHLFAFKGRVQVLTEAIYQERKRRASQAAAWRSTVPSPSIPRSRRSIRTGSRGNCSSSMPPATVIARARISTRRI